ncbi:MAG TPA: type III pantothenate kinase [Acidimicrobiales bacterium]|nr:type III pantothenate kinase [Acidimicrobiales bacterium]
MLLAVDVGNTETVVGLFEDGSDNDPVEHWRLSTEAARTSDELALLLGQLVALRGLRLAELTGLAVCSGVPRITAALRQMSARHLGLAPVVIGPGTRTGVPIRYENPREVGADRIANAVGALDRFAPPLVIVDFGTATTLDAITAEGEYLGGAIVPGVEIALEALYSQAALLRRVELVEPRQVIGTSTEGAIQSGTLYGTASLIDGMVARMEVALGKSTVVATGGLASLVAPYAARVQHLEPWLTLHGLRVVYERNRS